MSILRELGIIIGGKNKAGIVFEKLFPSFLEIKYNHPSDYVTKYWSAFSENT